MSDNSIDCNLLFWAAGSLTLGGICYYAYSSGTYLLDKLHDVPEYKVGDSLLHSAQQNNGILQYVAVSGLTKEDNRLLTGVHAKETEGLLSHSYIIEHSKNHRKSSSWNRDSRHLSDVWSSEPFSLYHPNSRIRLSVRQPLEAHELNLSTVYDHYEQKSGSPTEKFLDYLTGVEVVGIHTVEKMLLPNTKLTAIGKVVLHDGQLHIEKPEWGLKYFLTPYSIDSLIKSEESKNNTWRYVGYVFLAIGGIIAGVWLRNYYLKYKEELEYNRLERENSNQDDSCVICISNPKNIVLISCGHVCVCKECVKKLTTCPVCRKIIERKIPIYRS